MRLRCTHQALADLDEARTYIAEFDPRAASATVKRVREAIDGLRLYPERGRRGRVESTRELVVPGTPFIVANRSDGRHVDVIAVLPGARRWPSALLT